MFRRARVCIVLLFFFRCQNFVLVLFLQAWKSLILSIVRNTKYNYYKCSDKYKIKNIIKYLTFEYIQTIHVNLNTLYASRDAYST